MRSSIPLPLMLLLLAPHPVPAQKQDVSAYEERLNKIAGQISSLESKIKQARKRESSLLAQLERLGLQKKLIRNEIALYDTQREKSDAELSALKRRIPELEAKLNRERESVEKILVNIYKFGRYNYFELILQTDDVAGLLSENKRLALLAQHQDRVISEYLETMNEISTSRDKLEATRVEIGQWIKKAQEKQGELAAQERQHQALLRRIDQDLQAHQSTLEDKRQRMEELQDIMKKILSDKITLPFPLIPMDEKKGTLPWPIQGRVVTTFGILRNRRFNTAIRSIGIEISPRSNVVVKCVHPGIVALADYVEGYGYVIIIDHGMRYYSLYGHCSEDLLVKKGDGVQPGDPIAYVSDIGSLKGATLYFQINHNQQPQNPLQWLERR